MEWQAELERRSTWPTERLLDELRGARDDSGRLSLDAIARCVPESGAIAFRRAWSNPELWRASDALLEIFLDAANPGDIRALAIYAVTRLGRYEPAITGAVRLALEDADPRVRVEALRAFPESHSLVAADFGALIVRACADGSDDVVWTAVTRLGELGAVAKDNLSVVLDLLTHPSQKVSVAAAYALHALAERGMVSRAEITKEVEARPLTTGSTFLVCRLLGAPSRVFVYWAACLGLRPALETLAEQDAESLKSALAELCARDRAAFAALVHDASEEEDDYASLGRGQEEAWCAALEPFAGDDEVGHSVARLLERWRPNAG